MAMNCSVGTVFGEARERIVNPDGTSSFGKQRPGVLEFSRIDCKRRCCERCGPKLARRYRKAIANAAEQHGFNKLMTLTLDPAHAADRMGKPLEPSESVDYINDCWNKFRTYLARAAKGEARGGVMQFIKIVELQKSGMSHLHVLVNRWIKQSWISEAWQAVGGGKIVDVRAVDVHRVSAYVSKYLTKEWVALIPPKKKRVSTSRGVRLFAKREQWDWSIDFRSIDRHFARAQEAISRGSHKIIAAVLYDESGLKSFELTRCSVSVFDSLCAFFKNPYAALQATQA